MIIFYTAKATPITTAITAALAMTTRVTVFNSALETTIIFTHIKHQETKRKIKNTNTVNETIAKIHWGIQ